MTNHDALLKAALAQCEKEKIHQPGSIQPHGALLQLDQDFKICQASDNLSAFCHQSAQQLIGQSFRLLAGQAGIRQLESLQGLGDWRHTAMVELEIMTGKGPRSVNALVSRSSSNWLVEFEPAHLTDQQLFQQLFIPIRDSLWQLDGITDFDSYTQRIVSQVRQLTGYDRVMMYQFDANWDGEVIAESKIENIGSYLGHRFPASDIPAQARRLYTRNLIRVIVDTEAEPVALYPATTKDQKPTDLSYSAFRHFSPIHLEYLRNMGVRATLTISLLQNGRLWGMLACHHQQPKKISLRERELYEFIGKTVSIKLSSFENQARNRYNQELDQLLNRATKALKQEQPLAEVIQQDSSAWLALTQAQGMMLCLEGRTHQFGRLSRETEMADFIQQQLQASSSQFFVTDHLSALYAPAAHFTELCSGLLAIRLNDQATSFLAWFRPSITRTLKWAGEPHKGLITDKDEPRMSPRRSFAAWTQIYQDKSAPWTPLELKAITTLADVLHRLLGHQYLQQSEQTYRVMTQALHDLVLFLNPEGQIQQVTGDTDIFFGRTNEQLLSLPFYSLFDPQNQALLKKAWQRSRLAAKRDNLLLPHTDSQGSKRWLSAQMHCLPAETGNTTLYLFTLTDITQQYTYQQELEAFHQPALADSPVMSSEDQALLSSLALATDSLLQQTKEAVVITDTSGQIIKVNSAFSEITGYTAEEVIGHNPRVLKSGIHTADFYSHLWQALTTQGQWIGEIWNRRKNGEVYPQHSRILAVKNTQGRVKHYAAVFSDVTKAHEDERTLERLANQDTLTGLPNRRHLLQQMEKQLQSDDSQYALILIDFNLTLRLVNNNLGHRLGDAFILAMSQRLESIKPKTALLGRWSGEEFTLLLKAPDDTLYLSGMINQLLAQISQPVALGELDLLPSANIGAAAYPQDAKHLDDLCQAADAALYLAKKDGATPYVIYTASMAQQMAQRFAIASELRQAVQENQLILHYQPQVECQTGRVSGVEALMRWQHPQKGLIPPLDFIPVAEEMGMIDFLGSWLLRRCAEQLREWQHKGINLPKVAINIAPQQLTEGFSEQIQAITDHFDLSPKSIELEITEGALERNTQVIAQVKHLRALGHPVSIDDFGTGYSSLAHLKDFPVSCFKVDKCFIDALPGNARDTAILRSVQALGSSLGIEVLAEGVETSEQFDLIKSLGIETIQGYYFAKPMPVEELEAWLKQRSSA